MNNESTAAEPHLGAALLQEALWGEVPVRLAVQQRSQLPDCGWDWMWLWITVTENHTKYWFKALPSWIKCWTSSCSVERAVHPSSSGVVPSGIRSAHSCPGLLHRLPINWTNMPLKAELTLRGTCGSKLQQEEIYGLVSQA